MCLYACHALLSLDTAGDEHLLITRRTRIRDYRSSTGKIDCRAVPSRDPSAYK